jgi:hypothetical protein
MCCCACVAVQGWVPEERLDAAMEKYDVDKSGKLYWGTEPASICSTAAVSSDQQRADRALTQECRLQQGAHRTR